MRRGGLVYFQSFVVVHWYQNVRSFTDLLRAVRQGGLLQVSDWEKSIGSCVLHLTKKVLLKITKMCCYLVQGVPRIVLQGKII